MPVLTAHSVWAQHAAPNGVSAGVFGPPSPVLVTVGSALVVLVVLVVPVVAGLDASSGAGAGAGDGVGAGVATSEDVSSTRGGSDVVAPLASGTSGLKNRGTTSAPTSARSAPASA